MNGLLELHIQINPFSWWGDHLTPCSTLHVIRETKLGIIFRKLTDHVLPHKREIGVSVLLVSVVELLIDLQKISNWACGPGKESLSLSWMIYEVFILLLSKDCNIGNGAISCTETLLEKIGSCDILPNQVPVEIRVPF